MMDIIKLILAEIPAFVGAFTRVAGSPRAFGRDNAAFDGDTFNRALVFFGVSVPCGVVAKTPFYTSDVDVVGFITVDAIWKFALVCLLTIAIWLAWRIVGGQLGARQYFVATLYYLGTFAILGPLLLLGPWVLAAISTPIAGYYSLACYLALAVWCMVAWWAYVDASGLSVGRSLAATAIALVLSVLLMFPGLLLRIAYVGLDFSYGDFDPNQLLLALFPV